MVPSMLAFLICVTTTAEISTATSSDPHGTDVVRRPIRFGQLRDRPFVAVLAALTALCCLFSLYYVHLSYYRNRWDIYWSAMNSGPKCAFMEKELQGELGARLGLEFWRTDVYYQCAREGFLHIQ